MGALCRWSGSVKPSWRDGEHSGAGDGVHPGGAGSGDHVEEGVSFGTGLELLAGLLIEQIDQLIDTAARLKCADTWNNEKSAG